VDKGLEKFIAGIPKIELHIHIEGSLEPGLTVCPLSNLKLCVVKDMQQHPLKTMLDLGLKATASPRAARGLRI